MITTRFSLFAALAVTAALTIGCAQSNDATPSTSAPEKAADSGHSHDGWWCGPHGVPEEVCTRCHAELVAKYRDKGDWCKEHDVPDSQCFVCHPDREAAYAAQYEAKYGKQPPKVEAAGHEHDHKS